MDKTCYDLWESEENQRAMMNVKKKKKATEMHL